MALGARRGEVTAMVMRTSLLQAVAGLAIGVAVALLCVRYLVSQLCEVKHADAAVLTASILTTSAAALRAGFIPARRAASIEPAKALRTV